MQKHDVIRYTCQEGSFDFSVGNESEVGLLLGQQCRERTVVVHSKEVEMDL